ncbi:tyrosine-type recombinase/integrase [Leifsonia sp. NPDC014704]|uniref:tyrosine-type recombinase/integrase n=1 Tax=Leifsonia sp. NPDC014704 TaxID=3364123 RepID=UPI0036F4823D
MAEKGPNKLAKGEGSIYFRASDARWCGTLTLPSHDGKRRRKTVTGRTETEARQKLAQLRKKLLVEGDLPTSSQTFGSWLNVWFQSIALQKIRPGTARTYRTLLENHIIPAVGSVQLEKLTPAHIRRVADRITSTPKDPKHPEKGTLTSTYAGQAYRIMSVALEYALREGRVSRNVAKLTDAPRRTKTKLAIPTVEEARQVLRTVSGDPSLGIQPDRLASRWWAAFLTAARQGEVLGLELDRVTDRLDLSWQLQRVYWEHGCGEPKGKAYPCGAKRGTDCPDRTITFPPDWEHRHLQGGLYLSRPKTSAGFRIIPLVDPLRTVIEQRKLAAESEPNPHGLLWTADPKGHRELAQPRFLDGSPIDPRADNEAWHAVLARAGVRDARLHDARHTAASMLLAAGVPQRTRMAIMGHSSYAVTMLYEDVDLLQLTDAMTRMSAQIES